MTLFVQVLIGNFYKIDQGSKYLYKQLFINSSKSIFTQKPVMMAILMLMVHAELVALEIMIAAMERNVL